MVRGSRCAASSVFLLFLCVASLPLLDCSSNSSPNSNGGDAGGNACLAAGGDCEPVTQTMCTNKVQSALSCGTGTGVTCCLPLADGGSVDGGANACVAGGGQCVAVVPGACPNGTTSTASCGTGVGVSCCMPGDAATHD